MKTLTLIKNKTLLYPRTEEDYSILKEAGTPVSVISNSMYPLLLTYLAKKKVRVVIIPFSEFEVEKVEKLTDRSGFQIQLTEKYLKWVAEKTKRNLKLSESLLNYLTDWYGSHYVKTETKSRLSKSTITVILEKLK